jgi:hypothetical protein
MRTDKLLDKFLFRRKIAIKYPPLKPAYLSVFVQEIVVLISVKDQA